MGMRRGAHIEITDATFQGQNDVATPSSFERLDERHASEIFTTWEAEHHRVALVGDWHSHPIGDGSPSGTDRRAWRKLIECSKTACVGLILGASSSPRVFLVRRVISFPEVVECKLISREADDLVFSA
jgi:integrative and conjugative element protein (TIGR02256 family)